MSFEGPEFGFIPLPVIQGHFARTPKAESTPVEALNFFQAFFCNCLNWKHSCEDFFCSLGSVPFRQSSFRFRSGFSLDYQVS